VSKNCLKNIHFLTISRRGTRSKRRAAKTAQSHNLLQDFLILPDLVSNDSSHRAKEIGTKINKGQKFSSKLWLCAVMAARLCVPHYLALFSLSEKSKNKKEEC